MSKLKLSFRSVATTCVLAALMAAMAPGAVFGADQNHGVDPSAIVDQTPAAEHIPPGVLGPDENGPGGLDLDQLLPPALTDDRSDPTPATVAPADSPKSATTSAPKPAASQPKKAPVTQIAKTSRSRGSAGRSAASDAPGPRATKVPREPTTSASDRREDKARSSPTAGPVRETVPPSIVGRVINRIPAEYRVALVVLALLTIMFAGVSLRERRRSRRVERQALVDPLTALPNRQAFERRLAKEWRRAERYERNIGVLMLDLDDFKQINDGQGHAAGDRVLSEAAMLISGRVRSADMAARWGGDEFVVLCPETNAAGLKVLARSLEDRLRHAAIASSAGFAEREPGDLGPADLLARADASMYARKQRERVRSERRAVTLSDARSSFASLSD